MRGPYRDTDIEGGYGIFEEKKPYKKTWTINMLSKTERRKQKLKKVTKRMNWDWFRKIFKIK
jgi:hypothetical protein